MRELTLAMCCLTVACGGKLSSTPEEERPDPSRRAGPAAESSAVVSTNARRDPSADVGRAPRRRNPNSGNDSGNGGGSSTGADVSGAAGALCAAAEQQITAPAQSDGGPPVDAGSDAAASLPNTFGRECPEACPAGPCYVPGTGNNPICSQRCEADEDCGAGAVCQASGAPGERWCFAACRSDADCQAINASTSNPLYCALSTDPSDFYYGHESGDTSGCRRFCVQQSEP